MKKSMTEIRSSDAVLVNAKWVILDRVVHNRPLQGPRITELYGRHARNGEVWPVELSVPSDWTISVAEGRSAEAAPAG